MRDKITIPPRLRPPLSRRPVPFARAHSYCSRSCILDISSKRPRLRRRARSRTLGPHSHEPLFHLCNPSPRASSHTSSPTRIENRSIAKSPRLPAFSPLAKQSFIRPYRRPQYAFYLAIFLRKMSLRVYTLYQMEHVRKPFPKLIYVTIPG